MRNLGRFIVSCHDNDVYIDILPALSAPNYKDFFKILSIAADPSNQILLSASDPDVIDSSDLE